MATWHGGAAFAAAITIGMFGAMTAMVAPAHAQDSALQIIMGGEAYDGPPRFEVSFNGTTLGQRSVIAAIDTGVVGRFAEQDDKAAYVQSFVFDIPPDIFARDGEVRIRLINEAFGGEGSGRDRNLFLAAVTVNGRAVTVSNLRTETDAGARPNVTVGEFLLLADGTVEGVSRPPKGGWPAPVVASTVARATETTQPRVTEIAALPEASGAGIEAVALRSGSEECQLDQIYNVIGFNPNSNDLTARLEKRLDQILEDIGNEKCTVRITGYSSTQGDYATNALFAVERAQNVLTYLKRKGMRYAKVSASGAGETSEFGPSFAANRRVVITVAP